MPVLMQQSRAKYAGSGFTHLERMDKNFTESTETLISNGKDKRDNL